MMASYDRLKVAELKRLCDERGLQRGRMNKVRLIQVLRDYDANNDDDRESEAASDAEDSEV